MSAVSTKLIPASSAVWIIRIDSSWSVLPMAPSIIVPSANPLTEIPVPPRTLRSMSSPSSATDSRFNSRRPCGRPLGNSARLAPSLDVCLAGGRDLRRGMTSGSCLCVGPSNATGSTRQRSGNLFDAGAFVPQTPLPGCLQSYPLSPGGERRALLQLLPVLPTKKSSKSSCEGGAFVVSGIRMEHKCTLGRRKICGFLVGQCTTDQSHCHFRHLVTVNKPQTMLRLDGNPVEKIKFRDL